MPSTIVVGTDGSDTAAAAVDFAIDMAERYGARLVVASSYTPAPEDRLAKEQASAPQEIQWSINPMEDVEATLRTVEEKAREHGVKTVSEARQGSPADVLCEIAAQHDDVPALKVYRAHALGDAPALPADRKQPQAVALIKALLRGGPADQGRICAHHRLHHADVVVRRIDRRACVALLARKF